VDAWEKTKTASSIVAAIGIPVVLAIIGNDFSRALKEREIQAKFVELAVEILNSEPKPETRNIRLWATDVINLYSGVPLDDSTQQDLIERVPLVERPIPAVYGGIEVPEPDEGELRIEDGFLRGGGTQYALSPNTSGKLDPQDVVAVVIHATAGPSATGSVEALTDTKIKASTHILIGRDGSIFQIVPFDYLSWHAGRSEYQGVTGFNRHSLAISLDNVGEVQKEGQRYVTWFGQEIPPDEVGTATRDGAPIYWQTYTDAQIAATRQICELIAAQYDIRWILGHSDISRTKTDPGPLFPLQELQRQVLGHAVEN